VGGYYPQQKVYMQQPVGYQPPIQPYPTLNALSGAYADGVHDDTKALQRYFDSAADGAELRIPQGTYVVTSNLQINKRISLSGDGSTIQCAFPRALWSGTPRCDNHDTWKQYLLVIRAHGVSVNGLHFTNSTNLVGVAGLLVEGNDFTFSNCVVADFSQGIMIGKLKSGGIAPVTNYNIRITNNQISYTFVLHLRIHLRVYLL